LFIICGILMLIGAITILVCADNVTRVYTEYKKRRRNIRETNGAVQKSGGSFMVNQLTFLFRNIKIFVTRNNLRIGRLFYFLGMGFAVVLIMTLLENNLAILLLIPVLCIGLGFEMLIRYLQEVQKDVLEYKKHREKDDGGYNILDAMREE
jgi:hypothetical protein